MLAQPNDRHDRVSSLPLPVVWGGWGEESQAENAIAQAGIIITERKGARLKKQN